MKKILLSVLLIMALCACSTGKTDTQQVLKCTDDAETYYFYASAGSDEVNKVDMHYDVSLEDFGLTEEEFEAEKAYAESYFDSFLSEGVSYSIVLEDGMVKQNFILDVANMSEEDREYFGMDYLSTNIGDVKSQMEDDSMVCEYQ